ncbi:MAG: hypothetical protein GY807_04135 [Gammaproteobacteria bacterium]|nr:hypothetical protein [Gammaproteobacteria bacterium]
MTNFIAADIKRLQQVVEETEELPPASVLVVTEPSDQRAIRKPRRYRGISTPGLGGAGDNLPGGPAIEDSEDLFFPKPFNREQVAILNRLDQADGVVVQGHPLGPGKLTPSPTLSLITWRSAKRSWSALSTKPH